MSALTTDLRAISIFADLPDESVAWLAEHMQERTLAPGELYAHEGDPVENMSVVLEGALRGSHENGRDDGRVYMAHAGQVTGLLPFSRLRSFPLTTRAIEPTRIALLHRDHFEEMARRIPELQARLVNVMADRIRDVTVADQQREKLMALGKLSAGLAHELNNPASAARRSAETLREAVERLRCANLQLDGLPLTPEQRQSLSSLEHETATTQSAGETGDTLDRSDAEERLGTWLQKHQIQRAWELAGDLAEAGCDESCLNKLSGTFPPGVLAPVLNRFAATGTINRLVDEILNSTARISDLVRAIKEYSYMDQMPEQEMDLHQGLDNTLLILKHRWKTRISVKREYDRDIPHICAKGSELNQVWTNLIDNAIDAIDSDPALNGKGEIRIHTAREGRNALVEIIDNGPGIPAELQARIFEPFFTTKPVGQGTGLGLDTAYRIVRNHGGEIRLNSKPGETRFQVRLPLAGNGGGKQQ